MSGRILCWTMRVRLTEDSVEVLLAPWEKVLGLTRQYHGAARRRERGPGRRGATPRGDERRNEGRLALALVVLRGPHDPPRASLRRAPRRARPVLCGAQPWCAAAGARQHARRRGAGAATAVSLNTPSRVRRALFRDSTSRRAEHGAVAGEGFEPSKAEPTRLQRVPFDRSGTPPGSQENSDRPGLAVGQVAVTQLASRSCCASGSVCSFFSVRLSIWRTRSRVMLNARPTSSSVRERPPVMP